MLVQLVQREVPLGTTSASTTGSTGSLRDPGVGTLTVFSSTMSSSSATATDLSKIQVTVSADNLITRSLSRTGMKTVADSLKKESEK